MLRALYERGITADLLVGQDVTVLGVYPAAPGPTADPDPVGTR